MKATKNTMQKLFNVLEVETIKTLLKGIEREKRIHSQRATGIISKEQAMVYLDEILNTDEVAVLENYNSVTSLTTTEKLNDENQKNQREYDLKLFAKHKMVFNKAVAKHTWFKRLKYFLNSKECLTCLD
jgi:hypothetical protein